MKSSNSILSLLGRESTPSPRRRRNGKKWPTGDLSHWWEYKQGKQKSSSRQNNESGEPPWSDTRSILISIDTYHRQKPAPIMFGCAVGSKNQLGLTQLALTGLNGELWWHSLILSASSSQLHGKYSLLQNQLLVSQLDLNYNRDVSRLRIPLTQQQLWHILESRSMGAFFVASAPSSHDVVRPTSKSVPEPHGKPESTTPGRTAGSPDESNKKLQ